MPGYKLIGVFLLVVAFESVIALECYQCFDVEKCGGVDKNRIQQCDQGSAQAMAVELSMFYPKLNESLVIADKFQCASLEYTPAEANNATIMKKGCMYETKESLCKLEAQIPNGSFKCRACNTNKCNSGMMLGWSFLLLVVGLVATRMMK